MCNDFPSDILPWLHLKNKGIIVHQVRAAGPVLSAEEVKSALKPRTRVVCLPHVHTFSGWALDIVAIGQLCRKYGILFIVNGSQAVGAFEVNVADLPVDAIVCAGYKWLLGPYATGFCWLKTEVRGRLDYPQAYWTAMMDAASLNSSAEIVLKDNHLARRYDVFATANFFNYVPWKASIEYLAGIGIGQVARHNKTLVDQIIDGLDKKQFECLSPALRGQRTNIVVFSHQNKAQNTKIFERLRKHGLHLALWKGVLRAAPHIYNTPKDIERLLSVLHNV